MQKILCSLILLLFLFNIQTSHSFESFLVATQINTSQGLTEIQNVDIGDSLDSNNLITNITYQQTHEYIRIKTKDAIINVGIEQKFYVIPQLRWITAQELKIGDLILTALNTTCAIIDIARIYQDVILYKLSTTNHLLIISDLQLLVHNADIVLSPIAIGCISTINPVVASIGATLALGAGALLIYQRIHKLVPNGEPVQITSVTIDLSAYENQYYDQRKSELLKLKKELLLTKDGLLKLDGLSHRSFTFDFFKHVCSSSFALSVDESKLNQQQKDALRKAREAALVKIEDEINQLQAQICFHFSELVQRLERSVANYNNISRKGNALTYEWNQHVKNIPFDTAYKLIEETIHALLLIEAIEFKSNELHIAIQFYKNLAKESLIKKTTNIDAVILAITKALEQCDKKIKHDKSILQTNKQRVINFLQSMRAPVVEIEKNIRNKLTSLLQQDETQELQLAHSNYQKIPHHKSNIGQGSTSHQHECRCGCSNCESFSCGCKCGCLCGNKEKERKVNGISKQEFFNNPVIKANYEHYRNGVYKLKAHGKPIVKNAEYLRWDHLHNDVEVYNKNETHLGSLDPKAQILYKAPVKGRNPF
jgi:hypothetical protein